MQFSEALVFDMWNYRNKDEAGVSSSSSRTSGRGFLNTAINKLPFELHIPGYEYCGPGTRLKKRLNRGDPGINPLDKACKEHDIAYSRNSELKDRHLADERLKIAARKRVRSDDADLLEKMAALAVSTAMGAKVKMGMGLRNDSNNEDINKTKKQSPRHNQRRRRRRRRRRKYRPRIRYWEEEEQDQPNSRRGRGRKNNNKTNEKYMK